jgi:cell pole-organizing protein PopZ
MTDDKTKDDEPSIEEILSSIRDIISDDDEEEKKPEEEPAAEEPQESEPEEDVLELTDVADDEVDVDAMFDEEDNDDPLAGIDLNHPDDDDLEIFESEVQEEDNSINDVVESLDNEPETKPEPAEDDALLNQAASTATVSSMARLAENIAVSRTASGTTLEDIVRQLLRPMLKEWLDDNLPDVIERLVAKELERLAEKASRK